MRRYTVSQFLAVKVGESAKVKGELIVVFFGGILCGETYRPLGLNALWRLIGAIASFEDPFCFSIKPSMIDAGPIVGFAAGQFCIFEIGQRIGTINVLTPKSMEIAGSAKVVIDDRLYGMFYWVPQNAMMTFEELIKVGNALLLSSDGFVRTEVSQSYDNWAGDK